MPGNRPYDEFQLRTITQEMINRESTSVPLPDLQAHSYVTHEVDFVPYPGPGRIHRAALTIGNFVGSSFRVISPDGLVERAEERVERFERRMRVAQFIGERVLNPRTPGKGPNELIGWVGTHKKYLGKTVNTSAAGYLGKQLLDSKNESEDDLTPNLNHPSTRAERDRDRRIESLVLRGRKVRREAEWLNDSFGDNLRADIGVRLHPHEAKHMSAVAKDLRGLEKKAEKIEAKRNAVINYQDRRGKFLRWRLQRAKAVVSENNSRDL